MLRSLQNTLNQLRLRRRLLPEEEDIVRRIRSRFPKQSGDRLFFVEEKDPALPVQSSAVLSLRSGRWFAITNLAGFSKHGMTIDQVQRDFIDSEAPKKMPNQSPEATPGSVPPANPRPSSGAPQL